MADKNQIEEVVDKIKGSLPKEALDKLSPEDLKNKAAELLDNAGGAVGEISDKLNLDDLVKNLNLDDLEKNAGGFLDKAKDALGGLLGGDKK
jgi:hypothetical protein